MSTDTKSRTFFCKYDNSDYVEATVDSEGGIDLFLEGSGMGSWSIYLSSEDAKSLGEHLIELGDCND